VDAELEKRRQTFYEAVAVIEASIKTEAPNINGKDLADKVGAVLATKIKSGEIVEP
jgi:hypothetical protein